MLWILPVVPIVVVRQGAQRIGVLLVIATALTQVIYPRAYSLLEKIAPSLVLVLNLRNGVLLALLALLWGAVSRGEATENARRPGSLIS
jgi:hypothetical protein